MPPLVSAALIVRDEAHHLPACLQSLNGVVDEVVVVDTGSTDGTDTIARDAGAVVLERRWDGDFSAARNHGLDACRGRWILYIDADERLRPVARHDLEALLEADREHVAFRLLLRPRVGWTPYREFRVWRNDPRIRFHNVIHEQIVSSVVRAGHEDGLAIGDCDLQLDHVGYEGDQRHKHQRNLPLLREQLAEDPRNVFNWRHLASVLHGLDRPEEAEAALARALQAARDEPVPSVHGGGVVFDLIVLRHTRGEDVGALLDEAEERYPANRMWAWARSVVALDGGSAQEALTHVDRLLAVDLGALPDEGLAYDGRMFGAAAHAQRGLCLFRLGRFAEAAEAYAAAAVLEPDELEHRVKRGLCEARG